MESLSQEFVSCPYCGETIEVLIVQEDEGQQYIEDCQVCCRPIIFEISIGAQGELMVRVHDENDSF